MLLALRQKAGQAFLAGADILGMVLSFSGGAVVAFLGRAMLAVVLFAIALGFFLRLSGRRKATAAAPAPLPAWARPAAATTAAVVVALLIEATNLPVRFHQAGFEPWHWALVVAALCIAYAFSMRLLRALARRRA